MNIELIDAATGNERADKLNDLVWAIANARDTIPAALPSNADCVAFGGYLHASMLPAGHKMLFIDGLPVRITVDDAKFESGHLVIGYCASASIHKVVINDDVMEIHHPEGTIEFYKYELKVQGCWHWTHNNLNLDAKTPTRLLN